LEALFFTIPLQGQIALRVFGLQRLKGRVPSPLAERFMSRKRRLFSMKYAMSEGTGVP
jgi:hypothetical protein